MTAQELAALLKLKSEYNTLLWRISMRLRKNPEEIERAIQQAIEQTLTPRKKKTKHDPESSTTTTPKKRAPRKKRSDKSEVAPKTTDKIEIPRDKIKIPRDKIKIPREEIRKTSDKIQQISDKIAPPTAHRHTPKAQHARNQPQTKIAENRE